MFDFKKFYKKNRLWILLLLFAIILFLIFVPLFLWSPIKEMFVNPEKIRSIILSYESWALLVYVILSIIVIMIPVLPNEIVPMIGGMVFGFWKALIFGLIARIIGSTINYWLGTKIAKGIYLRLISKEDQKRLKEYTGKIGWQVVFVSRFLPSADTDIIAYVSGMARMNYLRFILASFFGMLVPVSATILLGASFFKSKLLFFVFIGFYVIGMLYAPIFIKRLHKARN